MNTELLNSNKINFVKPILKWVGGKSQILNKIIQEFPTEINNYHEIFLGGGSILFGLLTCINKNLIKVSGNIYAYDLNEPLIYVYKNIQTNHIELYNKLQILISEYNSCNDNGKLNRNPSTKEEALLLKENYYYWIRNKYNKLDNQQKNTIEGSSFFIFLNKTCFRGVFRIGPNGFNVPYGNYKNPEIINLKHLIEIHLLIKNVIFECKCFENSLVNIKKDDFIYLDPPYVPENPKSFVKYTINGFNLDEHLKLFKIIHLLTDKNIKMILSNSNTNLVNTNFLTDKYNVNIVSCKRSINSKNPNDKTNEVIIKNYLRI